jgi:hypothetical protein
MAYRVKAQFTDGFLKGWLSDVVAAPAPKRGETISVSRYGRDIPLRVVAVWTPSVKLQKRGLETVVMVEAREV